MKDRLLEDFLDNNPALSFIKDEQGRYLYASKGFRDFFKVSSEDFIGKTDFEWLPHDLAEHFRANDQLVRDSGVSLETIESVPSEEGFTKSLVHKFPINGPDGKRYVGGTAIDVTARLREQELSAKLAAIVDYSHDAILCVGIDGTIESWNESACRILGYSAEEVIGKSIDELIPVEFVDKREQLLHLIARSALADNLDIVFATNNGEQLFMSLTLSPVVVPEKDLKISIIARDVTKKKAIEAELTRKSQDLEKARDDALDASNLKSAFVANISHELRTPLTGILGFVELMTLTKLSTDQEELLDLMRHSCHSLLGVVNDVLDLSRIESGKVVLEIVPFNVNFLVQECSRLIASTIESPDLVLRTNVDQRVPEFVVGDPERIRQTLLNLLSNAIKFTESGTIEVRTTVEARDGDKIRIQFAVQDTGIGISENDQKKLFQPFTQVDGSSTRKYSGTGLGLSISKNLVELMGGTIGITSEVGKGAEFFFSVPFGTATITRDSKEYIGKMTVDQLLNDKVILIVEDNALIRTIVMSQLFNIGCYAYAVESGASGVDAATSMEFDLILMDCHLPDLDGFEATRRIRDFEARMGRHTPIIALTAGAMVGDRERCLSAGMDDYLSKPASIAQMQEKLLEWIPLKRIKGR
ncbi:MAG: PAS domain S-box protein [Candidatus Obscuribacterales bacterium]|nr:PAS domain S-box protein [Candidatus Obscuribacterales bacterium]